MGIFLAYFTWKNFLVSPKKLVFQFADFLTFKENKFSIGVKVLSYF